MPYHIIHQDNQYCVCAQGRDTPIADGCHDTEDAAQAHMAALYANESDAKTRDAGAPSFEVKFIGDPADGIIRGYRVLWGSPAQPDASPQHDYFRPDTDFMGEKFPLPHPLFFHHGMDAKTNQDPWIGTVTEQGTDEWGIWYKAQLRRAEAYDEYANKLMQNVRGLIAQKALKDSSDGIPQYTIRERQANGTHFVKRWALVAQSLTPIPAEPRMRPVSELQAAYKSIGVELHLPEASAEAGNRALAEKRFAPKPVTRKETKMKRKPLTSVKSMSLDELSQRVRTAFYDEADGADAIECYVVEAFEDHVVVREGAALFAVPYSLDAEGVPAFAEREAWTPVQYAVEPVNSAPAANTDPNGSGAMENNPMDEAKLFALLEAREKKQAEAKAQAEAEAKRIDELAEAKAQAKLAELAKQNRVPLFSATGATKTNVSVATKYDDMDPADLAFLATLRNEAKSIGKSRGADAELLRALAVKSVKAVEAGKLEAKALEDLFPQLPIAAKSNEVMQSTLASYGDEWVTTNFSSQLWLKIRDNSRLVQRIPEQEIPRGYESDTIPLESTDFTFYNVSQTASEDGTMKTPAATITSSRMGTGQRAITVGKLGARGEISGELDEDSIIDALPEARRKLEAQLPVEMEFLILNADDTGATSNINGNGTPTSGADYTLWKGMMVLGLTTNTANKYDMGAAINTTKIAALYATLGPNGLYVYQDPSKCLVVCDGKTWLTKIWTLSDLLTVANAGDFATVNRGVVADGGIPIMGVNWYPSAGVLQAQATGIRHSATGAEDGSDVYGRAVLVRPDQWKLRWKRRAKYETVRIPRADVTEIVVTMRFGLGYYDTDASSVAYNI